MCVLCKRHDQKIGQFGRALAQPLDGLSKARIATALRELQDTPPTCSDVDISNVIGLELRRVQAALDAFALPDLRELVKEIEEEMPKPDAE
ncbi:MAG: hypothetical protein EON54_22765 [Alcaligenaceae bacterium]|nr:MAG: hypothetical protein EON54_22765 [Alcaligenaceae bacterium]